MELKKLVDFVDKNPTDFHFIETASRTLLEKGFVELYEDSEFDSVPKKFFVRRSGQTLIAFNVSDSEEIDCAKIIAQSVDYPRFKIKPNSCKFHNHCEQLNVTPYNKGMWLTWMDRDLSIAGKVQLNTGETHLVHTQACATIPNLAIHLKPGSGIKTELHIEKSFRPVINFFEGDELSLKDIKQSPTLMKMLADQCKCDPSQIVDFDLSVLSAENAAILGVNDDLISSQRISSMITSFITLDQFVNTEKPEIGLNCLYFFTSDPVFPSITGPDSNFLDITLKRVLKKLNPKISFNDFLSNSMLYGIKNTKQIKKRSMIYYKDIIGNYQFPLDKTVKVLHLLKSQNIKIKKISTEKYSLTGAAVIGKRLNIPTFIFGLKIDGFYSIRETLPVSYITKFGKVLSCILDSNNNIAQIDQ